MKENKFVRLLRTLNGKELRTFDQHLHGLYAGQRKALAIFNYLKALAPAYDHPEKMKAEKAVLSVYGAETGVKNQGKNLQNTLSDLHQWLKEFLIWQEIKSDETEREIRWLRILKERQLHHEFFLTAQALERKIEKCPAGDATYFVDKIRINHLLFFHPQTHKLVTEQGALDKIMDNVDLFFTISKLKYGVEMESRQMILNKQYHIRCWPEVLEMAGHFQQYGLINLYILLRRMLIENDENCFFELKNEVLYKEKILNIEERSALLGYLINFMAKKIRQGRYEYYNEGLELYQYGLEQEILLENNTISATTFNNIVSTACWLKAFDWADVFIKKYVDYVDANERYGLQQLNIATVAFERKDYEAPVFSDIQKVEFTDVYFAIRARILTIRRLYEIGADRETILAYVRAFEHYLLRNKQIKGEPLIAIQNFLKLFKILVKRRMKYIDFKEKVEKTNPLNFQKWLLEKGISLGKRNMAR